MDGGGLILAVIGLLILPGLAGATPTAATPSPHVNYRHPQVPQTLGHTSTWVDTQLLNTLITSQTRRLEALEGRLGELDARLERRLDKLDTTLERRFDKLAEVHCEALSSHEGKEGVSRDQLARSINAAYERVVYMENNSIKQLQDAAGSILQLTTASTTMMRNLGSAVSDVKLQLNASHSDTVNQLSEVHRAVEQQGQGDGRVAGQAHNSVATEVVKTVENTVKGIQNHLDSKADMMSTKVGNMYNEMFKRVNTLETLVKSAASVSNATWHDVSKLKSCNGLSESQRSLHNRQGSAPTTHQTGCGDMPMMFENLANLMTTDLNRVQRGLEEQVQSVHDRISSASDTCEKERMHMEEKISEILNRLMDWVPNKHSLGLQADEISEVLNKLIDSISNKTLRLSKELVEVKRLLKSHNHHVIKGIGNNTQAITNITEGQKQNVQHLQETVTNFSTQMSQQRRQIEGLVETLTSILHNGTTDVLTQKINFVSTALQNMTHLLQLQVMGYSSSSSNIDSMESSDEETWKSLIRTDNGSETQTHTPDESFASGEDISQSLGHVTAIIQRVPDHNDGREIKAIIHEPFSETEEKDFNATTPKNDSHILALIHELQQYKAVNETWKEFINALMPEEHSTTESPLIKRGENQTTEHTDSGIITTDTSVREDDEEFIEDNDDEAEFFQD